MKSFFLLAIITFLTGCISLSMLPRDHDPVLIGAFIDTRLEINNIKCENKDDINWKLALHHSDFIKQYAIFRDDPQVESTIAVNSNIQKAFDANSEKMCNHWLNLTESRMSALETAWKGR